MDDILECDQCYCEITEDNKVLIKDPFIGNIMYIICECCNEKNFEASLEQ